MKKYCGCNNPKLTDYDYYEGMIVEMFEPDSAYDPYRDDVADSRYTDKCPVCAYNFWYRAHEENMMFDLKEMNQC